jgi:hypothetical protein
MIARPINRPQPIPFQSPGLGGPHQPVSQATAPTPRTVSWGTHSGHNSVAQQTMQPKTQPLTPHHPAARPLHPAPHVSSRHGAHGGHATTVEVEVRFMGRGSLSVRSSVTGRLYQFKGHGDSLLADKRDTLMLRRIADLHVM